MENTALNGTTNATKDHEDWKKKKGYRPILVAVSLALLLSLYAGGYLGSGTHLRHGEMGTTNAAASSSSTALVGSGTASDLKTLTMETDSFVSFYQGGPCVWTEQLPQCMGLKKYDDIKTAEACKNACCGDSNCAVWQFDAIGHSNDCFYGTSCGGGGNGNWSYGGFRTARNPGDNCMNTSDCATPSGLKHPVCRDGRCQSGGTGSSCGVTSDCVVPQGLEHPVCLFGQCQSGSSGSRCGQTSDCVVRNELDPPHAVCLEGKCQRGAEYDHCRQDNDCRVGKCKHESNCNDFLDVL